jgi:hypothetical protein
MPRKSQLQSDLENILDNSIFIPTEQQRQMRVQFWIKYNKLPYADPTKVDLATVKRYVKSPKLDEWWTEEGFAAWFTNNNEYLERLEVMVEHALTTLTNAMLDGTTPVASKITAAKLVLEAAGRMGKKGANASEDEKLDDMTEEELRKYIDQAARTIEIKPS